MKSGSGEKSIGGQPLLYVHAETMGELAYSLDYAARLGDIIDATTIAAAVAR